MEEGSGKNGIQRKMSKEIERTEGKGRGGRKWKERKAKEEDGRQIN